MKKYIILLVASLLSINLMAQHQMIEYSINTNTGLEFKSTDAEIKTLSEYFVKCSLQASLDSTSNAVAPQRYYLILWIGSTRGCPRLAEGGELLIKTAKGSKISLRADYANRIPVYNAFYMEEYLRNAPFNEEKSIPLLGTYTVSYAPARFPISFFQLHKICNEGVIKLRVATSSSYVDIPIELNSKFKVDGKKVETNYFRYYIFASYELLRNFVDPRLSF